MYNTKITDSFGFGQAIRIRRKKLGYTQKDISDVTGFSVSFISDVENGKPTAELDKALRLSAVLGMDCLLEPRG